jgi:hypothetical protein
MKIAFINEKSTSTYIVPLLRDRGHEVKCVSVIQVTGYDKDLFIDGINASSFDLIVFNPSYYWDREALVDGKEVSLRSLVYREHFFSIYELVKGWGNVFVIGYTSPVNKYIIQKRVEPLLDKIGYIPCYLGYDLGLAKQVYEGSKVIIKDNYGVQGNSVALLDSAIELDKYQDRLLTQSIIIQPFVENTYEVRVIFNFNKYIGTIKKTRPSGSYLNNLSQGASFSSFDVPEYIIKESEKIAHFLSYDAVAFDYIYSEKEGKYYFMEISTSMNYERLPEILGKDVLMDFFEQALSKLSI